MEKAKALVASTEKEKKHSVNLSAACARAGNARARDRYSATDKDRTNPAYSFHQRYVKNRRKVFFLLLIEILPCKYYEQIQRIIEKCRKEGKRRTTVQFLMARRSIAVGF